MIFYRQENNLWYAIFGHCCCFCFQGSGLIVHTAKSPMGPWTLQKGVSDIGCQAAVKTETQGGIPTPGQGCLYGGSTDVGRMVLLCGTHHRQFHRPGYRMELDENAVFTVHSPHGWSRSTTPDRIEKFGVHQFAAEFSSDPSWAAVHEVPSDTESDHEVPSDAEFIHDHACRFATEFNHEVPSDAESDHDHACRFATESS